VRWMQTPKHSLCHRCVHLQCPSFHFFLPGIAAESPVLNAKSTERAIFFELNSASASDCHRINIPCHLRCAAPSPGGCFPNTDIMGLRSPIVFREALYLGQRGNNYLFLISVYTAHKYGNPKSVDPLGFYKSHFGEVAGGGSGTVTSEVPNPHTATS
jgi:hypothetical protein